MERKRSIRTLIEKIYITFGILFLMLLFLCIGADYEQVMQQQDENLQTVTQIAVVNMDMGIERNESKLNYAAELVRFPDTNFTYTSLEIARNGIENGSYAAYIIIPEKFSACAASIENEPEKINIQYAVNKNLRADIYNKIIGDIHDFEISLNSNISYMYISAILMEFHEGQDAAETIMANDNEELNLILGIDAKNLMSELEIAEAEYPENKLEYTDLSEEIIKNNEYLKYISDYQSDGIEKGEQEFKKIKEADTEWKKAFADILETFENIEITKDEDNNLVYQEGERQIEEIIMGYLDVLQNEKTVILEKVGWCENELDGSVSGNNVLYDVFEESVEEMVTSYNTELEDAKTQLKQGIENVRIETVSGNTVLVGIDEVKAAIDELPEFTYESDKIDTEIIEEWRAKVVSAVKSVSEPETEKWYSLFQTEIIDKVLEEAEKENTILKEQSSKAAEEMRDYETTIEEFDPFEYMDMAQLNSYMLDLNENIYKMEDEINESTMEKEEYVNSLYGAVLDNENTWTTGLNQTYDLTGENIDEMVSDLKQNKLNMNQTNTELLLEFSNRLPYTRLGKVEYTELYDFVSHPLETQDLSTDSAKVLHSRDYEKFILFIIEILIIWLAVGGGYRIYCFVREEKMQDK